MRCTADRHGSAYCARKLGCTCPEALVALRRQRKRTRVRIVREGRLLTDPTGSIRRLQALRRMGYPLRRLAVEAGYTPTPGVFTFLHGRGELIHIDRARRIEVMYDRLSMVDGGDIRARKHAERMGWPPPLAWDDDTIDDPNARPQRNPRVGELRYVDEVAVEEAIAGRRPRLTTLERREAVARMTDRGMTAAQVADVLGLSTKSIDRIRARAAEGLTQGVADVCKAGHWYGDEGVLGRDRRGDRYCRVCRPNLTSHAA